MKTTTITIKFTGSPEQRSDFIDELKIFTEDNDAEFEYTEDYD